MSKEPKYFNFPIVLLEGFLVNDKRVLDNILGYAICNKILEYEWREGFEWVCNDDVIKAVEVACAYFGVEPINDKELVYENGMELYNSIPPKTPMVGISIETWKDYYHNSKTEFQKVSLLGFLAIKSILGQSKLCKTNNTLLIARMNGSISPEVCNDLSPYFKKITETKYKTRHHIQDKLIPELEINWGLKYWSDRNRGFYVSFIVELEKLASISEEAKMKTKKKKLMVEKQKIKAKLKTTP